jgi:phage I-like protein
VAAATLTGGDPAPAAPVQASLFGDEPPAAPAKPAAIPQGMMLVSASAWQQREDAIATLTAHMQQSKRKERDDVIAKAIQAGKFTPAQKQYFQKLWDDAPDSTREYIDSLMPNSALAVAASGYAGGVDMDDFEREYQSMTAGMPKYGS